MFCLVTLVGSAEGLIGRASATIQATATVVPAVGATWPADDPAATSAAATLGMTGFVSGYPGAQALSKHRLLVRYPSPGSVQVSIGSESVGAEGSSFVAWPGSGPGDASDLLRPGEVVVDLDGYRAASASSDGGCIVTLVYTEN